MTILRWLWFELSKFFANVTDLEREAYRRGYRRALIDVATAARERGTVGEVEGFVHCEPGPGARGVRVTERETGAPFDLSDVPPS